MKYLKLYENIRFNESIDKSIKWDFDDEEEYVGLNDFTYLDLYNKFNGDEDEVIKWFNDNLVNIKIKIYDGIDTFFNGKIRKYKKSRFNNTISLIKNYGNGDVMECEPMDKTKTNRYIIYLKDRFVVDDINENIKVDYDDLEWDDEDD